MFRKLLVLISGNALGSVLVFLRNIVLARMIGVEDFGIAATFAMATAVIEMAAQLGLNQLIVQADDGDDPDLQKGLQGFQLVRGLILAGVMVACAQLIADFMRIGHVAWAFQVLALSRVFVALLHFDMYRMQRKMRYFPLMLVNNLGPGLSLFALWPLSWFYDDYRVALYAILTQEFLRLVFSHLVAERPYRVAFNRAVIAKCLSFGWPLMLNGAILFMVFHGEKLVVGRELGIEVLALYALAVTLTMVPMMILVRTIEPFFLPQQAAAKSDPVRFATLTYVGIEANMFGGLVVIATTLLLSVWLVVPIFGPDFAGITLFLPWLAMVEALRSTKGGVAMASMAQARTQNALIANMCRIIALSISWWLVVNMDHGVYTIIGGALVGEFVGVLVSLVMLRSQVGISLRPLIGSYACNGALLLALISHFISVQVLAQPVIDPMISTGICAALFVVAMASLREFWRHMAARQATAYQ